MDEEQYSEELTALLLKLSKGHRVDMGQVVHGLSDVEREIFMAAADESGKKLEMSERYPPSRGFL